MTGLRFRLFAVLLALAPVGVVHAEPQPNAEALAVANDLFRLLSKDMVGEIVSKVTAQTWPAIESSLRANNPNADPSAFAEMRQEFEAIQKDYMADVLRDAPQVYARNFTAAELHDMMAFYQTPTGRKVLAVTPQITSEILAMLAPRVQEVMARTRAAFDQAAKGRGLRI